MPTYDKWPSFLRDWDRLTTAQKERFMEAVAEMVADLKAHRPFGPGLRVTRVQKAKAEGVWEMTWAPNGRATFMYGPEQQPGETHIVWRRIGGHDIFDNP